MLRRALVEFVGTMFLTYTIFATGNWMAIGAALSVACLLGGPVSGGSFNPAVTLALYSAGRLEKAAVVPYLLVECLGALAAYSLYRFSRR